MIAVSIVTYHIPNEELKSCFDTLAKCRNIKRVDVIDNGRDENTKEFVEAYASTSVLPLTYTPSENVGYGKANNISIKRSLDDPAVKYHLVMNSDILFSPETVEELAAYLDEHPEVAMAYPKVTDVNGCEQSSYHPLPSPIDLICHRFIPHSLCRKRMDRYEMKVDGLKEPVDVEYVHGCFMLMRVEALRKVGMFDERFFMYPEDIDISRRLGEFHSIHVIPWVSIVHNHRAESRHNFRMLWIHATNMISYFNKWGWFTR